MIKDPQVSGNYLVLQDCSGRNVNTVPVVRNDNDCSSQAYCKNMESIWTTRPKDRLPPLPKVTSPETVTWSNSSMSGMEPNLDRKAETFLKWLSPSFTRGVEGNILCKNQNFCQCIALYIYFRIKVIYFSIIGFWIDMN